MSALRRVAVAATALLFVAAPAELAAQGPPNAPINLQADVTSERVWLTWEEDDSGNRRSAFFYRIYRDNVHIGNSSDEDHVDSDVDEGRSYTYEVSAVDILGREGNRSAPLAVVIPGGDPPDEPEDLVAEAISSSRIDLRWEADDDDDDDDPVVVGYYIYRDGAATPHDSTGATQYSDTGLAAFTVYTYRVSAVSAGGLESDLSDPASARTFDGTPPTAPANLVATGVADPAIELDWEAAADPETGIVRYYVYRDGGSAPMDSTTATDYVDTNPGSEERTYEVAALNGAGLVGPRSNAASARAGDGTPPSAPSQLTAEAAGARLVELAWSAASDPESGISRYLVYRNGSSTPIDSTTTTNYSDGSVQPETAYSYRVAARNGAGLEGPKSEAAAVTTPAATDASPPSTPGDLTATAVSHDRVELTWSNAVDPESGISAYRVYRDDALLGTSPGVGFVDLTVQPDTTYDYEVSAVNGDGLEGERASASVTTPPEPDEPDETEDTVPPAPPTDLRVVTG